MDGEFFVSTNSTRSPFSSMLLPYNSYVIKFNHFFSVKIQHICMYANSYIEKINSVWRVEKCRSSQKLVSAQKWNPPSSSIIIFLSLFLFIYFKSAQHFVCRYTQWELCVKEVNFSPFAHFLVTVQIFFSFWWNGNGERKKLMYICWT